MKQTLFHVATLAVLVAASPVSAQLAEPIATTISEMRRDLAAESAGVVGARGTPVAAGPASFLYVNDPAHDPAIMLITPATGASRQLIAGDRLRAAMAAAKVEGAPVPEGLSDDGATLWMTINGASYRLTLATADLTRDEGRDAARHINQPRLISNQFPTTFGSFREIASPDGSRFLTLQDNDLAIRTGDTARRLTRDAQPRFGWRNSEESAASFNAAWSPDGATIAAIKLDERLVPHEPLLRPMTRTPTITEWPYPRAGEPMARFELWLVDAATGAKRPVESGATDNLYVNLIGWGDRGRTLWWQTVTRDHKRLVVHAADPSTGASRQVLTLSSRTYLDTPMTLGPANITPLAGSGQLLVMDDRTGVRQLYLVDGATGREIRRLSDGRALVHSILKLDESRGEVWMMVSADRARPYDRQVARVSLAGGAMALLTGEPGTYSAWVAGDGSGFVTRRSSVAMPPIVEARGRDGRITREIARADASGLIAMGFAGIEELMLPSADGKFQVRGIILKPFNFDPARRYPVMQMIYGGMQVSAVPTEFYSFGGLAGGYNAVPARALLHHDFVIVYVDAPGTPGRGRAFQDAAYGRWPQGMIADHAAWLRAAAAGRPWMDLNRVGIYGNSWGGYMTVRALIDAPDLYKVGVAMAAPQDFDDHPYYIEPFMGLPADNPAGYAAGSNFSRIGELKGRLLAISWPLDVNAGFSPWWKLIDRMVAEQKDLDLFTMPEINHRLTCCGADRADYGFAKITGYFRRWLGNER